MKAGRAPFWLVVRAHLRADAKKTAALVILILVMVVVYVRLFVGSEVPATADASSGTAGAELASVAAQAAQAANDQATAAAAERVNLSAPLLHKLARDPFGLDLGKYPSAVQGAESMPDPPPDVGPQSHEEKIRAAASALVFQGIVHEVGGGTSVACINDQIVRPGERIAGFVVQRVEPTRVVLECEGVRAVLNLR